MRHMNVGPLRKARSSQVLGSVLMLTLVLAPGYSSGQITPPGCPPGTVQPPPGLVAWWPLDETVGTAVSDHSSLGLNPGTTNAPIGSSGPPYPPKSVTGVVGNGLNFYFGSRVSVSPSNLNFGTTASFTIDAWIKGHEAPILSNYGSSNWYTMSHSGNELVLQLPNNLTLHGPAITPGAWTFVAVVIDRASQKVTLYTGTPNNNLSGSVPAAIPSTTNFSSSHTLDIGGCPGNPNGCDTIIDELEIFNRALTQPELQSIVNAGSAGKCIPQLKGMTWVHTASNAQTGTITVGCSGCDPIHGDTACTQQRPLLCIYKPTTPFPLPTGVSNADQYNRWSGGVVATSQPVAGMKRTAADSVCRAQFSPDWRAAEFHDGWGWNFQAYGGTVSAPTVPSTRFWVYINDKPTANCP